jgi:hypothetical protein
MSTTSWIAGTSITGIRANRPYALARILLARGIPVLFGYHGTITGDELPGHDDPQFLQLPVDHLTARLDRIASAPLGDAKKLFVTSFPIVQVIPFLNRFNAEGWVTVYDSLDDWEEFARASFATWYSSSAEKFAVLRPLSAPTHHCDFSRLRSKARGTISSSRASCWRRERAAA